ncbi:hypothetical protein [Sporosarcina sp. NPDC096371]|uniref:hypothetical protein n=1 Tax=Sporosarcina sp. NPDC096371 TaxID=3364530 RepID=UPI003827FF53
MGKVLECPTKLLKHAKKAEVSNEIVKACNKKAGVSNEIAEASNHSTKLSNKRPTLASTIKNNS